MARNYLIILVTLSFIGLSIQTTSDNTIDDESNPIGEVISSILKEQNGENIGALVQNVLQDQGGKIIGDALANLGKQNAGQLLQGLGSLLANQGGNDKEGSEGENPNIMATLGALGSLLGSFQNTAERDNKRSGGEDSNILETMGSLLGSLQNNDGKGGGGIDAGSLLQGLGGLLGGGQNGQGLDPSTIGSLVNMFAQAQDTKDTKTPEQVKKTKTKTGKKSKSKNVVPKKGGDDAFDFNQILSLVQSFLGGKSGSGSKDGFMQYIPMIMQTINSFTGSDAHDRERSHSDHSWKLPPFLEKLHLGFDHFMNSEMGQYLIETLDAEKSFKVFQNEKGEFDYRKFGEMMENRSFRRHWIKLLTERLMGLLQYISEPEMYNQYLSTGQFFINGYLKTQGFPKSAFIDPQKPVDSISAFANYGAKKYLDVKIQSREYVQPAVEYLQDLVKLARKKSPSGSEASQLAEKLTDTINLEIIEPLARVNRAYRYAKSVPKCTRYVLCLVNEKDQNDEHTLPKLKQMLYQGSSLLAAWFLSTDTDVPFWTLYSDITVPSYCKRLYTDECNGFHIEELKVTTEYVHSEL